MKALPTLIRSDVRRLISHKIAHGQDVHVSWLTHEIVQQHCEIEGDDTPFYLTCAYAYVREIVRVVLGRPKGDFIAGFTRLQVAYTVERYGETILVPVDQLTDAELLARATEYDDMVKGCRDHAVEIRKYVKSRDAAQAA